MKKITILVSIAILLSVFLLKNLWNEPQITENELKPNDWFFNQRAYPAGRINHNVYISEVKKIRQFKQTKDEDTFWEFEGPNNICGRISDVEMHAEDDQTVYIGAASGGIFKSENAGDSWLSVFDDAISLSIGDLAIAPSNSDIIYAGTGEANCGGGSQTYDGVGLYRSEDAGESWEHIGLEQSRNIGRVVVDPENPDIVYVAAMGSLFADTPDRGIYKTTDAGQSWQNILFVSDSTGGIDLVIHPEDSGILYAAMWERIRRPNRRSYGGQTCGLYKTENGGQEWTELTSGLPTGNNVGRIGIDICKDEPNILYAIYADKTGYFDGVFKTTDDGLSWSQTNDGALSNCYASYGWWFGRIKVDPVDPDIAYVIGFDLYKTSNGGNSWNNISTYDVHVDQHELFIHPLNHNKIFLGNDGGFYTSVNGGNSWIWKNNLPITQFYTCEVDYQNPERLYGGTQDNGTNRTMTGSLDDWYPIYWGDGFYVLVDPVNNNYVYAEYQYGNLARSTNGGTSFNSAMNGINSGDRKNWNTPVVLDPTNPEVMYYGANRLYKSTNRAANWSVISEDLTNGPGVNLTYGTITTISVSPINPEIIYVGTDDGNVWVSSYTGMGWTLISSDLPNRWVTRVAADPFDENTVYVTFSGYRWDEFLPHVFRSENKGDTWTDISGNLPELPVNDIIIDPENNETIYIATDAGVFSTNNLGEEWNLLGVNMPNVPVNDLVLHNPTRKLVAATFGRSMYSYDLYQDTVTTNIMEHVKLDFADVEVFPNPFVSELNIEISQNQEIESCEIFLTDISGKQVAEIYSGKVENTDQPIMWKPTFNIKEGIYFCVIKSGNRKISKKVIYQGRN
jgi:photosystem II stability/assembly factor-like uncharacterized protein